MPPDREQRVGVAGVFDSAHDQPRGHRVWWEANAV